MASAPLSLGQTANLIDLSFQHIFKKTEPPKMNYKKFFNFLTTEDYYYKDSSLSGLGEADFVDENSPIMSDVGVQGYAKTYTQNMVANSYPFTLKEWKFAITKRKLNNVAQELRDSVERVKEKLCEERLDNGFNSVGTTYVHTGASASKTITVTGGDSVNAFSNAHTREDGGTNMNNLVYDGTTYNLPFDYAGIKGAWRTAALFVDPRGNPRPAGLNLLVVKNGSTPHFKAQEILGAIKSGSIPESNDNDGSAGQAFEILALDYLQNSNQWYMADKSRIGSDKEGFQFVESQPTSVSKTITVEKTQEIQTFVTTIFDLGHNDVARSWVGSLGNSAAGG